MGTKATTLTRGIENQTDDATPNVEFLQSRGCVRQRWRPRRAALWLCPVVVSMC